MHQVPINIQPGARVEVRVPGGHVMAGSLITYIEPGSHVDTMPSSTVFESPIFQAASLVQSTPDFGQTKLVSIPILLPAPDGPPVGCSLPSCFPNPLATVWGLYLKLFQFSMWTGKVAILVLYLGAFAVFIYGCTVVEMGLDLTEVVSDKSYVQNFAKAADEYFHSYPVFIVYKDVDYPNQLQQLYDLEYEFVTQGEYMDAQQNTTSMLRFLSDFGKSEYCSNSICDAEVQWVFDRFLDDQDLCDHLYPEKGETWKDMELECKNICSSFCPQHRYDEEKQCKFTPCENNGCSIGNGPRCKCSYRVLPAPDQFYTFMQAFRKSTYGDMADALLSFDESGVLKSSRSLAYTEGVTSLSKSLAFIEKAREIVDKSDLMPANGKGPYPFGFLFIVNEQYNHLNQLMFLVLAVGVAAAAVIMLPLLGHPVMEILNVVFVILNLVELYGVMRLLEIKFNAVVVVNLVMAVGILVQFSCHLSRSFMQSYGSRDERAFAALKHIGIAILNGGFTLFLGLIFMSLSPVPYFRKYVFLQYCSILVIGLFNAIVVLPIVLSFIGPSSVQQPLKTNDQETETGI